MSQSKTKKNRYSDVSEMVREVLAEDQDFADEFEKHLAQRQIVKYLMALRASLDMSQQQIADKLGCTQSRISKLESGADGDLRFGDLVRYAGALGFKTDILLTPEDWTSVDEVKYHALCIKSNLDHLASLAAKDHSIAKGVAGFLNEAGFNLGRILQDSAKAVVAALRAFGKGLVPKPKCSSPIRISKKEADLEHDPEDGPYAST